MNSVTISKQHRLTAGAEMIQPYNKSGMKLRDWLEESNIMRDNCRIHQINYIMNRGVVYAD